MVLTDGARLFFKIMLLIIKANLSVGKISYEPTVEFIENFMK